MNTIGVLLLAGATATGGIWGKPHGGGMSLFRAHAVQDGPPPASGAVAGVDGMAGAGAAGAQPGRRFPNVRSQLFFVDPPGMKIGWQSAGPNGERVYLPAQLTVPARYNFTQGYIYRLKLTDIPGRPGLTLYPTIEVAPSTPATDAYLTHNPIPAQFTEEDFDQVTAGNFVTKVVYLPDPKFQELAIAGVETLVSTRLEPGVDPVLEADRRGTILMIIRVGAIDLEMPNTGGAAGPNAGGNVTGLPPGTVLAPGTTLPPGSVILAPGAMPPGNAGFVPRVAPPTAPGLAPVVPLDSAPVSPAPTTPPPTPAPAPPAAAAPATEAPPAEPATEAPKAN